MSEFIKEIRNNKVIIQKEDENTINNEFVDKAYKKICDYWDGTLGQRSFIKHLINAFYPISCSNKVFTFSDDIKKCKKNRCAILTIRLTSVKELEQSNSEISQKRLSLSKGDLSEKNLKELNKFIKKYPIEVRNKTIGYKSIDSDIFLSKEALTALDYFVMQGLQNNEKEIIFTIRKKQLREKNNSLTNSETNKISRTTTYSIPNLINESMVDKLKKLF